MNTNGKRIKLAIPIYFFNWPLFLGKESHLLFKQLKLHSIIQCLFNIITNIVYIYHKYLEIVMVTHYKKYHYLWLWAMKVIAIYTFGWKILLLYFKLILRTSLNWNAMSFFSNIYIYIYCNLQIVILEPHNKIFYPWC